MKEIGGYLEFEHLKGTALYSNLLAFNSSRNCLRYLIKEKKIQKLYLPIFLCHVVYEACKKEDVQIEFYHIDSNFMPILNECSDYVYIVNYYGLLSNSIIKKLNKKFPNMILDNTHAFFQKPLKNIDTIYNCRKYFGVPDGAYLSTSLTNVPILEHQSTKDMFEHLFGRLEENASNYYDKFSSNDLKFDDMEIKRMSYETINIMNAINYKRVASIRKHNFKYLLHQLCNMQKLNIKVVPTFMYPLLLNDNANYEKIRGELIKHKIYIPQLWPNVPVEVGLNEWEKEIQKILPIPIDQRYAISDMQYIIKIIQNYI